MKVLVSACAIGEPCKYNGKSNLNQALTVFLQDKEIIPVCPEMLAGMKIPRLCAELVNGRVMDEHGCDVDEEYRHAVELALQKISDLDIDLVVLQSRSPTCGVNQIYDGTFTGKRTAGHGLFAQALLERGYTVKDSEDFQ